MLVPPATLIDGCVRALRENVLPEVGARFARGQVYAVLDILQNLRDRIEEQGRAQGEEAASAEAALAEVVASLHEAARSEEARAIERGVARAPAQPPAERAAALRQTFVLAIDTVHGLPSGIPERARRALGAYLSAHVVRELAALKPSLLNEISKG